MKNWVLFLLASFAFAWALAEISDLSQDPELLEQELKELDELSDRAIQPEEKVRPPVIWEFGKESSPPDRNYRDRVKTTSASILRSSRQCRISPKIQLFPFVLFSLINAIANPAAYNGRNLSILNKIWTWAIETLKIYKIIFIMPRYVMNSKWRIT